MRKFFILTLSLTLILGFSLLSCDRLSDSLPFLKEKVTPIETEEAKMSYMLGYILAQSTKESEAFLEGEAFLRGVRDNIKDQEPVLSQEDRNLIKNIIQEKADLKIKKEREEKQKMESQNFLEENKKREGVKTTDSGLQYEVLEEGKGASPQLSDQVEVHYRGTLVDGTEFDSSYKRGETTKFPLNGVIKGWQEGLQLMKEGAKYKLYIPSDLAYGSQGVGSIPPDSTLVFEIELIKVN